MILSQEDKELVSKALYNLSCIDCIFDDECPKDEGDYACMRIRNIILKL